MLNITYFQKNPLYKGRLNAKIFDKLNRKTNIFKVEGNAVFKKMHNDPLIPYLNLGRSNFLTVDSIFDLCCGLY